MLNLITSSPPSDSSQTPSNSPNDVSSDVLTMAPTDTPTNPPSEGVSDAPSVVPSNAPSVVSTLAPTDSPTYAPSKGVSGAGLFDVDVACITEDECDKRQAEMEFTDYRVGVFPTKGCFSKNGVAYWSNGTEEEMTTSALPGKQKRIWCGSKAEGADSLTAQEASTFLITFLDDVSSSSVHVHGKVFILGVLAVVVVML
jgi:hypothetical protein